MTKKRHEPATEQLAPSETLDTKGDANGTATPPEAQATNKPKPKNKSPRERFLEHADRRINAALKCIQAVAKMGVRSTWETSEAEREQIISEIKAAYDAMVSSLRNTPREKAAQTIKRFGS